MVRLPLSLCVLVVTGWAWADEPAAVAGRPGDHRAAFVRVSPRDGRYFELSDGTPYVPIGLNMAGPPGTGLAGMEAWIEKLAWNHGNYARVWLSNPYFEVEHERSGQFDADKARRIDQLLQFARDRGVRLKLCIEHFRHTGEGSQTWAAKPMHLKAHGGPAASTADFFDNPACRELYKKKLQFFAHRYGDNPTVFAWELWNEMNCIVGGDAMAWTAVMLPELHRLFPRNLAVQSLGSYDGPWGVPAYRTLCRLAGNDVLQVHRYLDLGAKYEICHGPVDLLASDAVGQLLAAKIDKPVLLAESGAVERSHSGPFKLYAKDKAGIILHDVLFAPFFAGAAGGGHCWHWDVYVDRNDLWWQFGRFASAIEGIDPPAEGFRPVRLDGPRLRVYALVGRKTLLAWCRDSRNTWQTELADGRPPEPVKGESLTLDWPGGAAGGVSAQVYDPWTDRWTQGRLEGNRLALPEFTRSIVVRLQRK